ALVRRADHKVDQTRSAPLRPRPRRLDPDLDRQLERRPQAVRLAQDRRPDPRQPRRLLPADQRLRSLDDRTEPANTYRSTPNSRVSPRNRIEAEVRIKLLRPRAMALLVAQGRSTSPSA